MTDIDVFQTVTSVSFQVEPNTNVININKVTATNNTNLSLSQTASNFTINSDTGTDATIPLGNGILAGATLNDYTTAEKNKLAGIEAGANLGVPYIGATSDVNLGEFGIQLGNLEFDTTPTNIPTSTGSLVWNDIAGTLDLKLKGGNTTLQIGQETVARIINRTATNITLLEANYQVVRVTGAQGQRPKVDLALANNDLNSTTTLGLVTETILNNQEGFVTTSGQVQEINTTGSLQGETWLDGDMLYLSGTIAGRVTNIKPVAPTHTVIIGFVEYAHAVHGKIFVKVDNGYELDELHNVSALAPNNNEVLTYDTPTLLWKPKSISTVLGFIAENIANKSQDVETDKLSVTKYPSVKALYDWAVGKFQLTETNFGTFANSLTAKNTLVDADEVVSDDSADGSKAKKTTWLNVWINYIKVKSDVIYATKALTVRKISTATTLAESDNGTVILLTGSCTVTLPNGLSLGFNCSFVTATGATMTYALGGSIVLINNTATTMAEKLSHTITNTGVLNEYLTVGL